jgi:hypothetical protein
VKLTLGQNSIKDEIIESIISAGLLEDLISYLSKNGIDIDGIKKITDIDEEVLLKYAKEKGLLFESDPSQVLEKTDEYEDIEPYEQRPKTPPKNKR